MGNRKILILIIRKESSLYRPPSIRTVDIVINGKTFLSNWSKTIITAPSRPKIPIHVGRDADGEITDHIIKAKTKTDEIHQN